MTEAEAQLLRVGYRHRIAVADAGAGFKAFAALMDHGLTETVFHRAISDLLAGGLIHDPVRLEQGALQCHWHFELTPSGVAAAIKALSH